MDADEGRIRTNLRTRARILRAIRVFFETSGFLEVETPLLCEAPGMEPHLSPFSTCFRDSNGARGKECFLTTSPEHAMKRLIAAGFQNIYQLTRSFRNGELGPLHQPEFTILEWYRTGCDYQAIMKDCEALLAQVAAEVTGSTVVTYRGSTVSLEPPWRLQTVNDAVSERTGVDMLAHPTLDSLKLEVESKGLASVDARDGFEDVFFKLFLAHVEPRLGQDRPTILYEYPASMAALSRLSPTRPEVAERFELYIAGVELANAFSELTDPVEQRRRFQVEKERKERLCGRELPMDEAFLAALEAGLPQCAGIALGVDRLAMLLCDASAIDEVMAFPFCAR